METETLMFPHGIYREVMSVVTTMSHDIILFWDCFEFCYYNHNVGAILFFYYLKLSPCFWILIFVKLL